MGFRVPKKILKVLATYDHGSYLVYVTKTIFFINLYLPFQKRLYIKFRFDWQSSFREEDVFKQWSYTYYTSQNLIRATKCKFPLQNIQLCCKT